ncbi:MAG: AbrB/MazE/SpoVT family DNA-binding domain-containing protein [Rhodospirillales bacterium]
MTVSLKLTAVGNSTGLILPREMLADMGVSKGDKVSLSKTRDGYTMTPYNETFTKQMEVVEGVMNEHRDVLRELAK